MNSHKSEVGITFYLHTNQPGNCRLSPKMNTGCNSKQTTCLCRDTGGKGTLPGEREREIILCLMSSDVMRHIRDKLYETLNSNCQHWFAIRRFNLDWSTSVEGTHVRTSEESYNFEIWCPSGLKICILFSSKVKIYIKMRIRTLLGSLKTTISNSNLTF